MICKDWKKKHFSGKKTCFQKKTVQFTKKTQFYPTLTDVKVRVASPGSNHLESKTDFLPFSDQKSRVKDDIWKNINE